MSAYSINDFLKQSSELATISPAAVELINKINLTNIRRDEIARLVSADEILYANVFKYTNSAALGLLVRPRSVIEAIDILGINEVRNIVFAVAAKKVFVDLELWQKSVFTAVAAQKIAKFLGLDSNSVSNLYIAGLMQSMGTLVFKTFCKQEYLDIEKHKSYRDRCDLEKKVFGITNLALAYAIVMDYGLPQAITEIIRTQVLSKEDLEFVLENKIMDCAIRLSDLSEEEHENQELIDEVLNDSGLPNDLVKELKLDTEFFEDLKKEAKAFMNI
jgi:HD-like signal output (HDOD) protein